MVICGKFATVKVVIRSPIRLIRKDYHFKNNNQRSVAFGTWQVGGARNLTERRSEEPTSRLKCSSPDLHNHINNLLSIEKRLSRLGESSPNLSKIHHTHTQLSLGLPNNMSTSTSVAHDFFSSTEYCQYRTSREDIDSFNGNSKQLQSEPIVQATFRKSRKDDSSNAYQLDLSGTEKTTSTKRNLKYSQSSRRKLENSSAQKQLDQQSHHRSHSAGPHTAYSTNSNLCASTSEMNRLATSTNNTANNTKFLRATKRFFKRIYSSATLPKKQNSTSVENFQKSSVFFDERKCIPVQRDEEEDERSYRTHTTTNTNDLTNEDDYDDDTMRSENATMDISYPDSGFEMDRASTPEQSSVSMTSTSKSDESSIPMNFNNLFEHLKREMAEMRERDAQILADLQRVESQIQTVKQAQILAQLQDEFEPVESMQL